MIKIADKTVKIDSILSNELAHRNCRSSTVKLIQEIKTENHAKIVQAADFFNELMNVVKSEGLEITQLLDKFSEPKNMQKLMKIAQKAAKQDLTHPVEITDFLSPEIERLIAKVSLESELKLK